MKCNVPGQNVKVLGRTIHVLARFGDELYLESLEDCIVLYTINAAESAYAMVKFNKRFFSYFNYNYFSIDSDDLKCKISMKSALSAFKSPAHMDKQVENLEIKLDLESDQLIFQFRCKHSIVKTHYVSILDCRETNKAVYTKDKVPNRITSHQRIFTEALSNFQMSDDLVTLEASTKNLILRNYIDSTGDCTKLIRTQINLKSTEFDSYNIDAETTITFNLKEFRALLIFAEALMLPLQLHFETTGRPAVFIIHNGSTFEANFVLATSKEESHTQTTNHSLESRKRKSANESRVEKRPHLSVNEAALDEDSHLFNFVEIPDEVNGVNASKINDSMQVDYIPASPTSRTKIKNVFKRCFESTFDPRSVQHVVLADNSDSE